MNSDSDNNNNVNKAAALKYDGKKAPKLVAKGEGDIADRIIALAKQHNVLIHNDPELLEVLVRLELGDEIPTELYIAVAKVIAFAYYLQGKAPDSFYQQNAELSVKSRDEQQVESYEPEYNPPNIAWNKVLPEPGTLQSNADKKNLSRQKIATQVSSALAKII